MYVHLRHRGHRLRAIVMKYEAYDRRYIWVRTMRRSDTEHHTVTHSCTCSSMLLFVTLVTRHSLVLLRNGDHAHECKDNSGLGVHTTNYHITTCLSSDSSIRDSTEAAVRPKVVGSKRCINAFGCKVVPRRFRASKPNCNVCCAVVQLSIQISTLILLACGTMFVGYLGHTKGGPAYLESVQI